MTAIKTLERRSWSQHRVNIFRNGTLDYYTKARDKVRATKDTSDLQSEVQQPRRKSPPNTLPCSMDVDVDVDPSEETVMSTPPRIKRQRNMVAHSHANNEEWLQGGNEEGTVHNNEQCSVVGNQAENSCYRGYLERDTTLKSILEQNHVIRVLLTDVLQQLHELKEQKYKKTGDHHVPFLVRFPALKFSLSSDEETSLFENILTSGEEFGEGVQELHKIGGQNVYQFVKRVLGTLLTNHLAVTYSLMGLKGKKPFNKSIILNLVICAAEKPKIAANRRDTETAIQLWLKWAADRIAGTSKKILISIFIFILLVSLFFIFLINNK